MKPSTPATFFISDGRVYYLLAQLRRLELASENLSVYRALESEWNKFMRGPARLKGLTLPMQLQHPLRTLEAMVGRQANEKPPVLPAELRGEKREYAAPINRKPYGHWKQRKFEIEKKYAAGKKASELALEYDACEHMIFTLIYQVRRARPKPAQPAAA